MNPLRLLLFRIRSLVLHPFFLMLMLLLPVVALLSSHRDDPPESDAIRAGFVIVSPGSENVEAEPDALIQRLTRTLIEDDNIFRFEQCSSAAELKTLVASSDMECGYIIPSDLFVRLLDNDKKNLVRVLTSPKSSMVSIVNEACYASIFEVLSAPLFYDWLNEKSAMADLVPGTFSEEQVLALHDELLTDGSTFAFEYVSAPEDYRIRRMNVLLSPIRGLFALLILLSGFTGALSYYRSAKQPVYAIFSVRTVMILSPMILATAFSLFCYIIFPDIPGLDHSLPGLLLEALKLTAYELMCLVFLLLLTAVIKKRRIIYAFMPVYLLSCLFFSPIFVDASRFIPALRGISFFFLPGYYLMM